MWSDSNSIDRRETESGATGTGSIGARRQVRFSKVVEYRPVHAEGRQRKVVKLSRTRWPKTSRSGGAAKERNLNVLALECGKRELALECGKDGVETHSKQNTVAAKYNRGRRTS